MKKYIGITDARSREVVEQLLAVVPGDCTLVVGEMMSFKCFYGIHKKWEYDVRSLEGTFIDHPKVYNVLHYADYQKIDVLRTLKKLLPYCGSHLEAVQLDMVLAHKEVIKFLRSKGLEVIIQVSPIIFEYMEHNPVLLRKRLLEYGPIEHFLLDLSLGKGINIDTTYLSPFVDELLGTTNSNVIFAGALNEEVYGTLENCSHYFQSGRVWTDAQSGLRKSRKSVDPLNIKLASKYIKGVAQLHREKR